jgi:hypothetical protein
MKTKNENKKFTLEKFEVAKFKNLRKIIGGTSFAAVDDAATNTATVKTDNRDSSIPCVIKG